MHKDMPGFFATMKAINRITDKLLEIGKDYAAKFKAGEMSAQEYESEMVGKIYEITNMYSNGDEDLEKYLRNQFADNAVKFLKEGINNYIEGIGREMSEIPTDKEIESENEDLEVVPESEEEISEDISSNRKAAVSSKFVSDEVNIEEDNLIQDLLKLL